MKLAGVSTCPSDSATDVKQLADYISHKKGGKGCVREFCDYILNKKFNSAHYLVDELYFELTKPEYNYARADRVTIAFGVMATMKAWSQTQLV